jgi:phospholipid/cholesterol/gamma-HCH transport system substrate-binding protein
MGVAVLIGLIFLMSGTTGGLFTHKLTLLCYFNDASGLKPGAPVTLEGVTIGNVARIRVVPGHNPNPVEVIMRVGGQYLRGLHTDSTATITQAGVLGDSFVDIDSTRATGPPPADGAVLSSSGAPDLQDLVSTSEAGLKQVNTLMGKAQILVNSLNSERGTIGRLINDPAEAKKFAQMTDNLAVITSNLRAGKGTLGKLMTDDTLYNRFNSAVTRLNDVTTSLDEGKGTAGKLLHDDSLYKNLNAAVANVNQLMAQINAGKGALGKLAKDPAFAQKLGDTVTNLDALLKSINSGQGTLGQLAKNRALYNHLNQAADQAQQLMKGMRENPKKYLVIRLKLF